MRATHMTLQASLLRDMETPIPNVDYLAECACQQAKAHENKGNYEEALRALGAHWPRFSEHPQLTGLAPGVAAEVLLRAGVITSAIGSKNQLAGTQEAAKNLISESISIFQSLNFQPKIE